MSESIQIVLFTSVSGITDRHVRLSAVKWMEIIHVQRISGGITCTLVEGIVQDEQFIDTDLGIVSGFMLSVLHVVLFHTHESGIIVSLWITVTSVKYLSLWFVFPQLFRPSLPYTSYLHFHLLVGIHSIHAIIYLLECLLDFVFHFLWGDILICDWSGITQFLLVRDSAQFHISSSYSAILDIRVCMDLPQTKV